jgi:hypothetical protein
MRPLIIHKRIKFNQVVILISIGQLLLVGCVYPAQPVFTPNITPTKPAMTAILSVALPTATSAAFTSMPAQTRTATQTYTPTSTWTSEPSTPTLGPTLTGNDTEKLVLDLLENNGGCNLPCWWGFTPGKTTWEPARNFFLSHGMHVISYLEGAYNTGFEVDKDNFGIYVSFFIENDVIKVISAGSQSYSSPYDAIFGDPFFLKAMNRYLLPKMLATLGKPDQVMIFVLPDKSTEAPDYFFLLYYPRSGILLQYAGLSDKRGSELRLCPGKAFIDMWLWSPNDSLTLQDAFSYAGTVSKEDRKFILDRFMSWEAATKMTIDDFVTTFKVQNACFDTPATLWGRK